MHLKPKKIMSADDDAGIVDLLSIMLETEGYEVSSTLNGNSLLDIHSDLPDIILMDIQMPHLDGYEATKRLRKLGCKVPVVAITAHAMPSEKEKCRRAGCDS